MKSRSLTKDEITLILSQLPTLRDQCLFILGTYTGFRISELLSLRVSDVQGDTLSVRRRNMKGKQSSRTVPLHSGAKDSLKRYLATLPAIGDIRLFPITRQHAWRVLKQASERSHLKGVVATHSMRKSFAMSIYERSGKDLRMTQQALGHKSISSTGMYLSVDQGTVDALILSG